MHSDLCLSFPVGDILSESTGSLPNFSVRHCREKVQELYTWRDSQHYWEEKRSCLNAAYVKNKLTNDLLAHLLWLKADYHRNKTATAKETLCYRHLNRQKLNVQRNKGCQWNPANYCIFSPWMHCIISLKRGKTDSSIPTCKKLWWQHCSMTVGMIMLFCQSASVFSGDQTVFSSHLAPFLKVIESLFTRNQMMTKNFHLVNWSHNGVTLINPVLLKQGIICHILHHNSLIHYMLLCSLLLAFWGVLGADHWLVRKMVSLWQPATLMPYYHGYYLVIENNLQESTPYQR